VQYRELINFPLSLFRGRPSALFYDILSDAQMDGSQIDSQLIASSSNGNSSGRQLCQLKVRFFVTKCFSFRLADPDLDLSLTHRVTSLPLCTKKSCLTIPSRLSNDGEFRTSRLSLCIVRFPKICDTDTPAVRCVRSPTCLLPPAHLPRLHFMPFAGSLGQATLPVALRVHYVTPLCPEVKG